MNNTVYVIKHRTTDTVLYVGKTSNFNARKWHHFNLYSNNTKDWIAAIGTDNLVMEKIAEFESDEDALRYEDELITRYNTIENGYNKNRSGLIQRDDMREYKRKKQREYAKSEKYKEYQREYSKSEKFKENQREYRKNNKEYIMQKQREYRARKKAENNEEEF